MRLPEISRIVQVPDGVEIGLEGKRVNVKGVKGTLSRDFSRVPISIDIDGKAVRVSAKWPRKKEAALIGTIHSHIQNMVSGVQKGYTYKIKIVFSHFPISAKVQGTSVLIENFTGERRARRARVIGDVKVRVDADDILVQGLDLEEVSQTAANIEQATRVRRKDPRVFLDGLYVYERTNGME